MFHLRRFLGVEGMRKNYYKTNLKVRGGIFKVRGDIISCQKMLVTCEKWLKYIGNSALLKNHTRFDWFFALRNSFLPKCGVTIWRLGVYIFFREIPYRSSPYTHHFSFTYFYYYIYIGMLEVMQMKVGRNNVTPHF